MKITIDVAPVTPEARQAIEDAWTRIIQLELEERARVDRERTQADRAERAEEIARVGG